MHDNANYPNENCGQELGASLPEDAMLQGVCDPPKGPTRKRKAAAGAVATEKAAKLATHKMQCEERKERVLCREVCALANSGVHATDPKAGDRAATRQVRHVGAAAKEAIRDRANPLLARRAGPAWQNLLARLPLQMAVAPGQAARDEAALRKRLGDERFDHFGAIRTEAATAGARDELARMRRTGFQANGLTFMQHYRAMDALRPLLGAVTECYRFKAQLPCLRKSNSQHNQEWCTMAESLPTVRHPGTPPPQ